MASYVINLENSQKVNHYSFGSVEMTALEYDRHRQEAGHLESSLIQQKQKAEDSDTETEEPHDPAPKDKTKVKKNHLRLV